MSWYGDLKIRSKLLLGYAAVVVITLALGLFSYVQINKMREADTRLYEKGVVALDRIGDVSSNYQRVRANLRESILENDQQRILYYENRVWKFREVVGKAAQDLEKSLPDAEARRLLDDFVEARKDYGQHLKTVLDLAKQNKDKEAFAYLVTNTLDTEKSMNEAIDSLTRHLTKTAKTIADQDNEIADTTGRIMIVLACSASLLATIIAILISRSVVSPLRIVLDSVRSLQEGGKQKAGLVEAIAGGDLSRDVIIAKPLQFETDRISRDEAGMLLKSIIGMSEVQFAFDQAFARMTESLRRSSKEEQGRDWLKTGMNELNTLMRGDQETKTLAEKVIRFIAEYLHAGVGALYIYHEHEQDLELIASFAFTRRKNLGSRFKLGEGLIGQAAQEGKLICLSNVPPDYFPIGSALGEAVPRVVTAVPFLHDGKLIGAMELGSFDPFSDAELDLLTQAMESLAIGINVNLSRQRINELLTQSQSQEEELRVQQEELQQSNEELEERAQLLEQQREQIKAKNREVEEASRQILRKAEELERVSTYKSEFLANMSHELRTPLNSLMILSRLLMDNKEGNLNGKQLEYAGTINSSGNDLLSLINDILDLSKIESGKLEFTFEDIRADELFDPLRSIFVPLAEEKGLSFEAGAGENLPLMRIDMQRTLQILKNILSNALKFTQQGSVALRAFVPDSADNPLPVPSIAFSVRDTGIGIPADKHELVFQAFKQADGTTSRRFGGTGLGLSISRQLALGMNGDIQLASEVGKGSVFTLYLPINGGAASGKKIHTPVADTSMAPVVPGATKALPSTTAQRASTQRGNLPSSVLQDDREQLVQDDKCILIIEDDLNFAGILMQMVREREFKALVAADGQSGLDLAEKFLPSAIILDVMLPGMDGWAVMQKLTDNLHTRHIPVHFLTCLEERQKAMTMGAIGFVNKPVSTEQLDTVFGTIEKAVSQKVKKLLIVEDNEIEAISMRELLQQRDIAISVAATGADAVRLLSAESFDCIILDLGLTDMSGFDLLEHIHGMEEKRRIPVIIHSGQELSREDEHRLERYAKSIIIKGAKSPERLLNEVTLFLHVVESNLHPDKQRMIRTALDTEVALARKKVLIVDDDMRNVFSLSSVLSEKQMQVIEAENGKEALKRLGEHPDTNIVLMDIMMPEMDGYETTRLIRKDPRFTRLPIIALTAKAMKGDREACLNAGASDYIAKPVDIDRLLSLLRVWLYNQG